MSAGRCGYFVDVDSFDKSVSAIAAVQHGAFATTQLDNATKSRIATRVAAGRWHRVRRGIFVVEGSPRTWEQRMWIRLLGAGDGAVVGLRSALILHTGRIGSGEVEVMQPESTVPSDKPGHAKRTNRLLPEHITRIQGFPVTTLERTLFDLASITSQKRRLRGKSYLPAAQVEQHLEAALARNQVSVASMLRVYRSLAGQGRGGTCLMRDLLEARGDDYVATESVLETRFVELLKEYGLPQPSRQVSVGSEGKWLGRVDFYFDDHRLIVEADSFRHHSQRTAFLRDHRRDLEMSAEGWQVQRLDWWQLNDERPVVAASLRKILAHRRSA